MKAVAASPGRDGLSPCPATSGNLPPSRSVEPGVPPPSVMPLLLRPVPNLLAFVVGALLAPPTPAPAQGPPPGAMATGGAPRAVGPDSATLQAQAVRVFLDCQGGRACGSERDFYVTEINFVNWMRDRFDAEVQLLVSALGNGGGGTEYTVTFIGRKRFEGMTDTLVHNSLPNDPDARIRADLARTFKLGLARYVAKSGLASRLQLAYVSPMGAQQASPRSLKDPWNFWVFSTNTNFSGSGETRQQFYSGSASFSAARNTESLKLNLSASGNYNESDFNVPAGPSTPAFQVTNIQRGFAMNALSVWTLSPHWSAGMKAGVSQSDFLNQAFTARLQPAVEYNVFKWSDQTRRQLTFLYNIGPNRYQYQRRTILGFDRETRWSQQFTASLVARQSWGSANVSADWLNYLHDFDRHALTLSGFLDLRIGRGLSMNIGGNVGRVRDQIYLPAAGNTEEEILLRRQALQTDFRIGGFVGIRYQFGSIYNTIVNQRFSSLGSSGGRFFFF